MSDIANIGGSMIPIAASAINNFRIEQVQADNATVGTAYELVSNINADPTLIDIVGTTAGDTVDITSSDTKDDGAPVGVGARTVKLTGLDAAWIEQTETVTLNGSTGAPTTASWAFINKAEVVTVGSELDAAGALTVADVDGSNTIALIDAGGWRSQNCMWQVGLNQTGYIYGFWYYTLGVAAPVGYAVFALQVHKYGLMGNVSSNDNWETIAEIQQAEPVSDAVWDHATIPEPTVSNMGFFSFPGNVPLVIGPKDIVRIAAKATSTAVAVSAGFQIIIQGTTSGGTTETDN